MPKDLYLATYCVGSMEEVLAPLHKVCSLLLALRREYGIALFERVIVCLLLPPTFMSKCSSSCVKLRGIATTICSSFDFA